MPDVGDAVTLVFETTTGATVTAEVLKPDGTTVAAAGVPEAGTTGQFPFTFVGTLPDWWRVLFVSTTPTATQVRWVRFREISTVPPLASPDDVAGGWRALTGDEQDIAADLIDHASLIVRHRLPTLDARMTDGSLSRDLVAVSVGAMVRRVMQNPPPGMQSWTLDDYTERFGEARARLWLEPDELALLQPAGTSSGAFTIRPAGTERCYTPPLRYLRW